MRKFIIPAIIIIFWAVTMAVLVKKEILPSMAPAPSFQSLKEGHYKMKILVGSYHIGNMETSIERNPDNSFNINEKYTIRKSYLTKDSDFQLDGSIHTTPDSGLKNFIFSLTMFGDVTTLAGYQRDDYIELITTKKGETSVQKVPGKKRSIFSGSLMPLFDMNNLSIGREWSIEWMNPLSSSKPEPAQAKVEAKEMLAIEGKNIETFLVTLEYQKTLFRLWVDMKGEIVKYSGFGFTLIREGI